MKTVRVRTATIPHVSRARGSQRSGKRVSAALPDSILTFLCVVVSKGSSIYFYSILGQVQNSIKTNRITTTIILPHTRNTLAYLFSVQQQLLDLSHLRLNSIKTFSQISRLCFNSVEISFQSSNYYFPISSVSRGNKRGCEIAADNTKENNANRYHEHSCDPPCWRHRVLIAITHCCNGHHCPPQSITSRVNISVGRIYFKL